MKTKRKFIDEVTGDEYDTEAAALKAERKNKAIEDLFSFVDMTAGKKDKNCDFGNGGYCVQRTREYYDKFRATIVAAVRKHEKWIAKSYAEHKDCPDGLTVELAHPFGILGRYLGDGGGLINHYFNVYQNICTKCYREWGQGYYAIHCPCNGKSAEHGLS